MRYPLVCTVKAGKAADVVVVEAAVERQVQRRQFPVRHLQPEAQLQHPQDKAVVLLPPVVALEPEDKRQ